MRTFLAKPSIISDNSKIMLFHFTSLLANMGTGVCSGQSTFEYAFPAIEWFANKIYKKIGEDENVIWKMLSHTLQCKLQKRTLSSLNFIKMGVRNMYTFLVTPSIFNGNSKGFYSIVLSLMGTWKENLQHTF